MSVELPKPVAHVGWVGNKVQYVHAGGTPVYTDSQLQAYAISCVQAERAKNAALIEAADGLRDALIESRRELQAIQAAVHLHGGFDPAYVKGAKASLNSSHDALAKYEETP